MPVTKYFNKEACFLTTRLDFKEVISEQTDCKERSLEKLEKFYLLERMTSLFEQDVQFLRIKYEKRCPPFSYTDKSVLVIPYTSLLCTIYKGDLVWQEKIIHADSLDFDLLKLMIFDYQNPDYKLNLEIVEKWIPHSSSKEATEEVNPSLFWVPKEEAIVKPQNSTYSYLPYLIEILINLSTLEVLGKTFQFHFTSNTLNFTYHEHPKYSTIFDRR